MMRDIDPCSITDYDVQILRELNGETVEGLRWGAAMANSCEFLRNIGYAEGNYRISKKGKEFLKVNGYGS